MGERERLSTEVKGRRADLNKVLMTILFGTN